MRLLFLLAVVAVTPSFAADTLRIRAVGDVMLGTTVPEGHLPPDDGAHLLDDVASLLQDADVTFANMEGPLCDNGTTSKCKSPTNCYAFRSPTRYGKYVKEAGVDLVSTANNHSGDFGEVCRRETEATLDALGIVWSGPPGSIGTLEKNGRRIGLVAFHTSAGCNDVNQLDSAVALVKQAKAKHDWVIVSFHGGAEGTQATRVVKGKEMYLGENRGDLVTFTHAVIDAGADLVLGHGPHVLRALEVYRGRLIVYSMGNFATYGRFNLSGPLGVGMVMEVELANDGTFTRGKILPTQQEGEGVPKKDPSGKAVGMVKKLTALDFPETGPAIADDGTVTPRSGA
ncbi:MAG: CapA family protein [Myxococcaceae bacterium]|nr:CapA family protein [Myxococcaceae bacterium]